MRTRTNIHLDKDAHDFASAYANAKGISLGVAISELIRSAEQKPEPQKPSPRLARNEHGYLEITSTGDVITPEMVKDAAEDELV